MAQQNLDELAKQIDKFLEEAKKELDLEKLLEEPDDKLMKMDMRSVMDKATTIFKRTKEILDKLYEIRKELRAKLREERAVRDEWNKKVSEISGLLRKLYDRRKELQTYIKEKRSERDLLSEEIRKIEERIQVLRRELRGYKPSKLKELEDRLSRYEWAIQTKSLPSIYEDIIIKKMEEMARQIRVLRQQHEKYQELRKLERDLKQKQENLRAIKRALALYLQERKKIDEEIRKLLEDKSQKKGVADEYHAKVLALRDQIRKVNEQIAKMKDIRWKAYTLMRRIGSLRRKMIIAQEEMRRRQEIEARIKAIMEKLSQAQMLDLDELKFLWMYGPHYGVSEDVLNQIAAKILGVEESPAEEEVEEEEVGEVKGG